MRLMGRAPRGDPAGSLTCLVHTSAEPGSPRCGAQFTSVRCPVLRRAGPATHRGPRIGRTFWKMRNRLQNTEQLQAEQVAGVFTSAS